MTFTWGCCLCRRCVAKLAELEVYRYHAQKAFSSRVDKSMETGAVRCHHWDNRVTSDCWHLQLLLKVVLKFLKVVISVNTTCIKRKKNEIMINIKFIHFKKDSCANLDSFKIVVLSIQIKTVFLKWTDFKSKRIFEFIYVQSRARNNWHSRNSNWMAAFEGHNHSSLVGRKAWMTSKSYHCIMILFDYKDLSDFFDQ